MRAMSLSLLISFECDCTYLSTCVLCVIDTKPMMMYVEALGVVVHECMKLCLEPH